MSRVEVQRSPESRARSLPTFDEFEKIVDRVRMQAYKLFAHRGASESHAREDWLAAERAVSRRTLRM